MRKIPFVSSTSFSGTKLNEVPFPHWLFYLSHIIDVPLADHIYYHHLSLFKPRLFALVVCRLVQFNSASTSPDRYITQIHICRSRATLSVSPSHPRLTESSLIILPPALDLDPIYLPRSITLHPRPHLAHIDPTQLYLLNGGIS